MIFFMLFEIFVNLSIPKDDCRSVILKLKPNVSNGANFTKLSRPCVLIFKSFSYSFFFLVTTKPPCPVGRSFAKIEKK